MAIETLVDDELPEEPDPDDELPEELAWAVPVVEEAWAEPDGAVTEKLLPFRRAATWLPKLRLPE